MRLLLLLLLPLLFCTDGCKASAVLLEPLTFDVEPPGRLEFLLSEGGSVACGAQGDASVTVQWVYADTGQPVTNVSRLREVYPKRLVFPGALDELYRVDVHHQKYRCRASGSHGTILSRVVHVEAAVKREIVASVGEQFVSEGEVAVISCHLPASLDRWVTVSAWTLGQQLVVQRGMPRNGRYEMLDSGQLLVSSVTRADSGHEFSCFVKHRLTHQQHTSTAGRITVLDPRLHHPATVASAAKMQKMTKKVGERITLLCEAHGNPLPAYTWYKVDESGSRVKLQRGHQQGPHHPARTISDLTLDDSGTYVCQAANQLGHDEAEITLSVTGDSLTVRVLPERQVVGYGDPATVNCQHEGGHVERTYWLRDGHPLAGVTGDEVRVESVREGEVGMYQCFVENDLVTAQASAIIAVGPEVPPRWEVEPEESIRVEVGGSVTIPCRASGVPTPTLTWTRFKGHSRQPVESAELCGLGVSSTRDGTLVVGEVRRTHAGYFICRADNGVGSGIEAVVMLQVVAAPEVIPISPLVRVPGGQDAELGCRVEGADGEGVVWKKDGHTIHYHLNPRYRVFIEDKGDGVVVSRFTVVTAGPQDAGHYTCSAASVWAAAQAGVSLVVEDGMEHSVPRYGVQTSHEKELGQILEDIDKWGIDIFKVAEFSNGQPLTAIMYTIFKKSGLIDAFHMNPRRLVSFLGAVEGRYNPVPFHNSLHSADVAQSAHVLLNAPSIKGKFTDLEIMATLIACAIHDVDHQGRTNQCLNPSATIPQVVNETRLEQHHLSVGFYLLESGDLEFLSGLSAEETQHFEELVKEIVLGTDLRKHPDHKAFLKSKTEGGSGNACGNLALEGSQDRIKLLSSVVHVADLSTAAKPFPIYDQWARAIMKEFFTQGDNEKLLGHSVAPLCDRTVADIDQKQIGFLDHFVLPLWESWVRLHPYADYMLAILRGNRDKYRGQGPVHQPLESTLPSPTSSSEYTTPPPLAPLTILPPQPL